MQISALLKISQEMEVAHRKLTGLFFSTTQLLYKIYEGKYFRIENFIKENISNVLLFYVKQMQLILSMMITRSLFAILTFSY